MELTMKNEHGMFTLDAQKSAHFLNGIFRGIQNAAGIHESAATCCGHTNADAFNNVSGAEALFMWIESGNYVPAALKHYVYIAGTQTREECECTEFAQNHWSDSDPNHPAFK